MTRSLVYGILLAAGSGTRFGAKKQYLDLAGKPVWQRSLNLLIESGVDEVLLVVPDEDRERLRAEVSALRKVTIVVGGATRSQSVQAALAVLHHRLPKLAADDCVVIHDAARPFADVSDVQNVIRVAQSSGGAILARPCTDTVKQVVDNTEIRATIPREALFLAETPQVFWWEWVRDEYLVASADALAAATDDASIMESAGKTVRVVASTQPNLKITKQIDREYAQWLAMRLWGGK